MNPPFVNVLFAPPSFLQCQIRLVIAKLSKSNTEPRSFSFFLPRLFHPRKVLSGKLDETLFRSCPGGKSRKEAAGNPYWIPLTSRVTSNSTRPSLGSYKVFYPDFFSPPSPTRPPGHTNNLLGHTPMYYVILIL